MWRNWAVTSHIVKFYVKFSFPCFSRCFPWGVSFVAFKQKLSATFTFTSCQYMWCSGIQIFLVRSFRSWTWYSLSVVDEVFEACQFFLFSFSPVCFEYFKNTMHCVLTALWELSYRWIKEIPTHNCNMLLVTKCLKMLFQIGCLFIFLSCVDTSSCPGHLFLSCACVEPVSAIYWRNKEYRT